MGYQPPLTNISEFKKSSMPCLWNFFFGIDLRCLTGRIVGLYKGRLEVYLMVTGLYYDLQVDYATQLWNEFVKSVGNTNAVDSISYARYWSIILRFAYEKEGIAVLENEETAEFSLFRFPKIVEDDDEIFPNVARIHDAML